MRNHIAWGTAIGKSEGELGHFLQYTTISLASSTSLTCLSNISSTHALLLASFPLLLPSLFQPSHLLPWLQSALAHEWFPNLYIQRLFCSRAPDWVLNCLLEMYLVSHMCLQCNKFKTKLYILPQTCSFCKPSLSDIYVISHLASQPRDLRTIFGSLSPASPMFNQSVNPSHST